MKNRKVYFSHNHDEVLFENKDSILVRALNIKDARECAQAYYKSHFFKKRVWK